MVYLLLLLCGVCSGFLAGLLGIGGGFVVVPALLFVLPLLDIDAALIPTVAVATSLAAMVPTAVSAVFAQYRRQALQIEWVRLLAPGVAIGSALGSKLAVAINGMWITVIFAVYTGLFAIRLIRQTTRAAIPVATAMAQPAERPAWMRVLPQWSVGLVIGGFSSLAGVGGASLIVPYLLSRKAEMRQASAASSAVGLVIAIVGAAGFGLSQTTSQSGLVGFVCWQAALAIGVSAIVAAPVGVALAHRLSVGRLKQAFAVVLLLVAASAVARAVT